MILPLIISYAEIHYHLKKLFPFYYKKFPEVLADLPLRCIKEKGHLPVLIIVKDSHLFPIELTKVTVFWSLNGDRASQDFNIEKFIEIPYWSRILHLPLDKAQTGRAIVNVEFEIKKNGRTYQFTNDNYDLPYKPFECFVTDEPLPYPTGWYAGDPHYHSLYTEDQVEFGADIPATMEMASCLGLSWFFVTDHSYDLDDSENSYTQNDPDLPKWKKLKREIGKLPETDVKVIPGEEVSIGNSQGRNVHLLAINHPDFIPGKGDGAEKWFCNEPDTSIKEIADLHDKNNLFMAAHPWEAVPFLQKLTLRRGNWQKADFDQGKIKFLQIINGRDHRSLNKSIKEWTTLLLAGKKLLIAGGNDAHGNFNIMRQIKIPFIKLFSNRSQIFGDFHTVFRYSGNDPVAGLKQGTVIVSNGPFLEFMLSNDVASYPIGSTIKTGEYRFKYRTATTEEFGKIIDIRLYQGDLSAGKETSWELPAENQRLKLENNGYLRMEMKTRNGGLVLTNPIWYQA